MPASCCVAIKLLQVDIEMGREGKKGEASTMSALRMKVQESKQRGQAMAANYEQAIAANQQLVRPY